MINVLKQKMLVSSIAFTVIGASTASFAATNAEIARIIRSTPITGEGGWSESHGYENDQPLGRSSSGSVGNTNYGSSQIGEPNRFEQFAIWGKIKYSEVNNFLRLGPAFGNLLTSASLKETLRYSDEVQELFARSGPTTKMTNFRELGGRRVTNISGYMGQVEKMANAAAGLESDFDFLNSNLDRQGLINLINECAIRGVNFRVSLSPRLINGLPSYPLTFQEYKNRIQYELAGHIGEAINAYVKGELNQNKRETPTKQKHRLVLQTALALYSVSQVRSMGTQQSPPQISLDGFISRLKSEINDLKSDRTALDPTFSVFRGSCKMIFN